MSEILRDGSVLSTNTIRSYENINRYNYSSLCIAVILEVIYIDDPRSVSRSMVEYNVKVDDGLKAGFYNNVVALPNLGGIFNFSDKVYKGREKSFQNKNSLDIKCSSSLNTMTRFEHDGDQVVLGFLDGNVSAPIILGSWNNCNIYFPMARREDGTRFLEEFNGVRTEINKEGEWSLTYLGGVRDLKTKKTKRHNTAPTQMKIDKDGSFELTQATDVEQYGKKVTTNSVLNKIKLSRNKTLHIKIGNHTVLVEDNAGKENIIITHKKGGKVVLDTQGNIKISTNGGHFMELSETGDKATLSHKSEGKIIVDASGQKLGGDAATHPIVHGDTLVQLVNELNTKLQSQIIPGTPGQNAASLANIKVAFGEFTSAIESILSEKSVSN